MELTLESGLSTGALVGHLSYFLLVISMTMRVMWVLRLLVIMSAFVAIFYDLFWLKDPVGVFWESLLVMVNIIQLAITYIQNRRLKFTEEEAKFVNANFPGLSLQHKHRLLNLGRWSDGAPDMALTREGEPVDHLIYLANGEVSVMSSGEVVGHCGGGAFIGEMTVLTGAPANGTAIISRPTRYWSVAAGDIRNLIAMHEEIGQALQASFQRNLVEKLLRSNKIIVDAGTMQALPTAV